MGPGIPTTIVFDGLQRTSIVSLMTRSRSATLSMIWCLNVSKCRIDVFNMFNPLPGRNHVMTLVTPPIVYSII